MKINSKKFLNRDTILAYMVILTFLLIVILLLMLNHNSDNENSLNSDSSISSSSNSNTQNNNNNISQKADNNDKKNSNNNKAEHKIEEKNGITYIDGILIVNKTYELPQDYNPGLDQNVKTAFDNMSAAAYSEGISLWICSGFRSYYDQNSIYNGYVNERGVEATDRISARPGHSEHQSGLAIDVNNADSSFENSPESLWLKQHCAEYGFIIRYPKGKEDITGYKYEPWHIRYVGTKLAKELTEKDLCLEEYFNITSSYND